ncbi:MarR family winged helix-turn-helix transcriptional regulator [Steroidobacter flavus]|uniref:MarR family winged helix-turn-helix transcriptional regulator n=1 Tax=Steroidobacter flavus TaxID=1842136 RepID=A0ABV8SVV2_9GAMM
MDDKLDTHALAMVSFIYNRVVAGAAGALRKRLKLSVTEARIALHVGASDSVTAAELVRIMGLDKAAISRGTARLIELGLIKSEPDPQHAARNILSVTKSGRICYEAIANFTFAREEYLLSVLSAGEQKQFLESLRKVLKNVEPTNERARAGDFWD